MKRPDDESDELASAGERLRAAAERVKAGDGTGALYQLFELLHRSPIHADALRQTAALTAELGAEREAHLFARVAEDPDDTQALYDLGYLFVESGFPAIAVGYLRRCLEFETGHALVRYELAYALFSTGEFMEALEILDELLGDPGLGGPEEFAGALLRVQCLVYIGRLDDARSAFESIDVRDAGDEGESQLDATAGLIARASVAPATRRGPRDWQFIEHGSAVLHVGRETSELWLPATLGFDYLGGMLRRLLCFLEALGHSKPQCVQYIGDDMHPLALAIARRLSAEVSPIDDASHDTTLIVMREPNQAAAYLELLRSREEGVDLFTLFLDPRRDYPVAPELIGQFAAELKLPWDQTDGLGAEDLADEIEAAIAHVEDDEGDLALIADYYRPLREQLVFGNYDRHPARRVCTARRAR